MGQLISLSICLTDLPKEKITTSEKNGKKYINLIVDERKEVDNYGNTHSVSVSQTKDEREAKAKKVYVGNGKAYTFNQTQQPNESGFATSNDDDDNLPF